MLFILYSIYSVYYFMFSTTNFHSINSNKWWRNWKNIQPCSKFDSHMFCSFNTLHGAMKDLPLSVSLFFSVFVCRIRLHLYIFFSFTFFTQKHIVLVSKQPWNQTKFPWLFVGARSALFFLIRSSKILYFDLVFVTLIFTTFPISSVYCGWMGSIWVCMMKMLAIGSTT